MPVKRSIFKRLTLFFSVFTILSITVVSVLLYAFAVLQLKRDFYNYNDHLLTSLSEFYGDYLDDLCRLSAEVQGNVALMYAIRDGEIWSAGAQVALRGFAEEAKALSVDSLLFYLPEKGSAVTAGNSIIEHPYEGRNQYWYQELLRAPRKWYAGPGYQEADVFFTVSFIVAESSPGTPEMILRMNVSKRLIEEFVYMVHIREEEKVFLYQNGKNLLYSNAAWFISKELTAHVTGNENEFSYYDKVYLKSSVRTSDGLVIAKIAPQAVFLKVMQPMLFVCAAAVLVFAVVSFGFARAVSRNAMANVYRLLDDIRRVSAGNFDLPKRPHTKDEIGIISQQFSGMAAHIQELLSTKYRLMRNEQKALMRALEARVNPHFLNNTLQAISGRAYQKGDYELCNMVNALADMYRYCIKHSSTATVADELENARQYVTIWQLRFGERLQVRFDIDHTALDMHVPRLCMQIPIENSIKYAMEDTGSQVLIVVKVMYERRVLELLVEDNGVGLGEESLSELRIRLAAEEYLSETSTSTGLAGLYGRLKLTFGDDAEMQIESKQNEYFRTTIRIANQEGGQEHADSFAD